jgi:disease resistance protein RPM1
VSATTGALKPVVVKLATLMGDEHKSLKGVHVEIKLLADKLSAMDTFLLNMAEEEEEREEEEEEEEEEHVGVQDKAWMNKVRELSYDMEDSIDDFIMQTIISGDKDVDNPDHGKDFKEEIIFFLEKVKDLSGVMKVCRQVGGYLKEEIVEVVHAAVDPAALAMFELLSKRDEPKTELLKLFTQDEEKDVSCC